MEAVPAAAGGATAATTSIETSTTAVDEKKVEGESLQAAFERFRAQRKQALKAQAVAAAESRTDPARQAKLRKLFVETALKYIGVPYAARYHGPDSQYFNAPLYLDCCGLVRRVLDDLTNDFGFRIGRWNQAYQFDTLPTVLTEDQMQPGDLVFYTGTYFNPRAKRQKHDMVHVEIWLGEGKTLGARWQRGTCQIHESYKFESKNYHSIQYHFRSIDTWLQGVCKSHCEQHPWETKGFSNIALKKSVFADEEGTEGGHKSPSHSPAQTPLQEDQDDNEAADPEFMDDEEA